MQALMKVAGAQAGKKFVQPKPGEYVVAGRDPHAPQGFKAWGPDGDEHRYDEFAQHLNAKHTRKSDQSEAIAHWLAGHPEHRTNDPLNKASIETYEKGIRMPWKEREKYVAQRAGQHPQSRAY